MSLVLLGFNNKWLLQHHWPILCKSSLKSVKAFTVSFSLKDITVSGEAGYPSWVGYLTYTVPGFPCKQALRSYVTCGWQGYPTRQTWQPTKTGYPTYHVNMIKLKWEITVSGEAGYPSWVGYLTYLGSHVNRPLGHMLQYSSSSVKAWKFLTLNNGVTSMVTTLFYTLNILKSVMVSIIASVRMSNCCKDVLVVIY